MHTKAYTSARFARRVYRSSSPIPTAPAWKKTTSLAPSGLWDVQAQLVRLVRNPLFLVILTWLVMAALLVVEIAGGQ